MKSLIRGLKTGALQARSWLIGLNVSRLERRLCVFLGTVHDRVAPRVSGAGGEARVPRWGTADDVLADPDVPVVVNLTVPAAHVEVSEAAVAAGKHVWTEEPIGLERRGVDALLRSADAVGLRVGSAPDTVQGPGFQMAKRET